MYTVPKKIQTRLVVSSWQVADRGEPAEQAPVVEPVQAKGQSNMTLLYSYCACISSRLLIALHALKYHINGMPIISLIP